MCTIIDAIQEAMSDFYEDIDEIIAKVKYDLSYNPCPIELDEFYPGIKN